MKICFISYGHISITRGGIDRVTNTLANSLLAMEYEVLMLSVQKPFKNDPIENYQFFLPSQDVESQENKEFLERFIRKHKIDVLILQSENITLLNLLLMGGNGIPIVAVIHVDPLALLKQPRDTWDLWKYKEGLFKFYLKLPYFLLRFMYQKYSRKKYIKFKFKYYYEHVSALVLLSKGFIGPFCRLTRISRINKLYAIGNPLSFTIDQCSTVAKEKIILFVGRLDFSPKRLDRLINVWHKITDKQGWKIQVLGDGSDRNFYELLCRKYNIYDIEFLGRVDPLHYYQKASILCVTSSYEGFCMVITEALQNEVIPIAFDSYEAVWDIIQDNYNGFIVKPFSLIQYRKILQNLMLDSKFRDQIRHNIRIQNKKNNKFDRKQIASQWDKLLKNIILSDGKL